VPHVSVIVPAYNAANTLVETLQSVLQQTYHDFEILVVDDGSTDATATVVESFGPKVRYVRQDNAGVSGARNTGASMTSGDLLAFLDADDLWAPNKLERQIALLRQRPDVGVTYVGAVRIDAAGRAIGYTEALDYADPSEALLLHSSIVSGTCSSTLVRRTVAHDVPFDPAFSQCADWDYWIRLSLKTGFAGLNEPLMSYRTSPNNMSSDIALLERDTFAVLDKFYATDASDKYRPIRRRVYSNHWMIVSGSYLHARRAPAAVRCMTRGLLSYPANVAQPLGLPYRWTRRRLARSSTS
jgi:glycosyltransferase involved in cell wall biosynthesis